MHYAGQIRVIYDTAQLQWLAYQLGPVKIGGADLKIIKLKDPPTMTMVSLWISCKPDESDTVFGRLAVQNPDFKINSWCGYHTVSKKKPVGQLFIMEVDRGKGYYEANLCRGKLKYWFNTLQANVTQTTKQARETVDVENSMTKRLTYHQKHQTAARVQFVQIKTQHSRAATDTLCRYLRVQQNNIVLIQEPWIVEHRICRLG